MDGRELLIRDLIGKKVLIKSHLGAGTKEYKIEVGEYRGVLLDFDGVFLKLEYEVSSFTAGATKINKEILLLNLAYLITIQERKEPGA